MVAGLPGLFLYDFSSGEKCNHFLSVPGKIIELHADRIGAAPDNFTGQINMFAGKGIKEG